MILLVSPTVCLAAPRGPCSGEEQGAPREGRHTAQEMRSARAGVGGGLRAWPVVFLSPWLLPGTAAHPLTPSSPYSTHCLPWWVVGMA